MRPTPPHWKFPPIPLLLFTLCLAACQAGIGRLFSSPGEVLLEDGFSDPASGWQARNGAEGSMGYEEGAYQFSLTSPGMDMLSVTGHVFRDVHLEVSAALLTGAESNRHGLVCAFKDARNFFAFLISSDGYYAIARYKDGSTELLGQTMMAYSGAIHQGAESNRLRFDCTGSSLRGWVNGQLVAVASDESLGEGAVGLIAGSFEQEGVVVKFDDFQAIKP